MRLIRSLISLALLAAFVLIAVTVPLGKRTLFGHVKHIWSSDEAQELVEGVREESGPFLDRVKRGVKAGVKEATTDSPAAGSGADSGTEGTNHNAENRNVSEPSE